MNLIKLIQVTRENNEEILLKLMNATLFNKIKNSTFNNTCESLINE